MKRIVPLFLAVLLTTLGATASRHLINVGDFTTLMVIDNLNVVYTCNADSAGMAVVDCDDAIAQMLIFRNDKGRLKVQISSDAIGLRDLPTIYLYSADLNECENAGDSALRIMSVPEHEKFTARLSDNGKVFVNNVKASELTLAIITGRGRIFASGECEKINLKLVGSGEIQADDVKAGEAKCTLTGTGRIGCYVDGGELYVKGAGTGKVYYRGTPSNVKMRKLGPIKAIPMTE